MKGRWPNTPLFRYSRMSREDTILWNQFIHDHGPEYESFDYDLPVGEGETPQEDLPDFLIKDWQDLTKKRIDAVGYKNNTATIFEVKPRAGTSALGQLLTYKKLFSQTFPSVKPVNLTVICSLILNDEKNVYNSQGITIYQYTLI